LLESGSVTPIALVHGGGFGASCWDLLMPLLETPAVAVDLPGRGRRPAPLLEVTFSSCAEALQEEVDAAGFDRFVVVGHSLAGCSMPAMVDRLGDRVAHLVFLACTVPADGTACLDTLDPEVRAMAAESPQAGELGVLPREAAAVMFGNDLDRDQLEWCLSRMVPEAPRLVSDQVDLSPFRRPIPRTWILTLHDAVVPPAKQERFAKNVGETPIVPLDAAHMSMISRPAETAALLNEIAHSAS
jgi:pimeloyl-ACP methyl ester carboxylesterase